MVPPDSEAPVDRHGSSTCRCRPSESPVNRSEWKELEADVIRLRKGGADVETLLSLMRERRLSQTDSFLILARVSGFEFAEAQKLVFESKTWADRREINAKLQEDLIEALRELSQENDPNFKIEIEESSDEPEQ